MCMTLILYCVFQHVTSCHMYCVHIQYFPDRFVRREIQALEVKCKFQYEGCGWEGTYGDLPSHLNACKYAFRGMKLCPLQPLGCSNKSSMDDNESRKHLQESEYNHLTTIVNCIQLLSRKLANCKAIIFCGIVL